MAEKKTIAVFGATGAQGGGLVRAILADRDGPFSVRAITRNPESDVAKELASAGAEVVQADLDQPDTLRSALEGAYGAYCVTFFWNHFSPETELEHARAMAEAAKNAGVEHVIWSTLEDTRNWVPLDDDRMPTLQGKYKVPHFDAKGEANTYFIDAGLPTTFLVASFYWDNLIHFGMGPKRGDDGALAITFPMGDKRLAGVAAEDIGKCAYGVFKEAGRWVGETVGIAGGHPTCAEMAASLTQALGEQVRYNAVSPQDYRRFGFPGADDLGNMFQFYADFEEDGLKLRNLETSRSLNASLQTFAEWLAKNKARIPLE